MIAKVPRAPSDFKKASQNLVKASQTEKKQAKLERLVAKVRGKRSKSGIWYHPLFITHIN